MILDSTNKSLQFVLASSVATNQLPCVTSWADMSGTTFTPGSTTAVTSNTTAVTIVAAPGSSTQRQIKNVNIYNADTANADVAVVYNDNSSLRTIVNITLQPGETLQFAENAWSVIDGGGRAQTSVGSGSSSSTTSDDPTQFDVHTYGAVGDGVVVTDGAMTSGSATLACTTSTPFSSGDVGKHIVVSGAGGGAYTPLCTTIASFTNSGHVTLSASASSTISSSITAFATDDTTAINDTVAAAHTYWLAHPTHEVTVNFSQAVYGIAGAPVTGTPYYGNAQIPLPVNSPTSGLPKFQITFKGLGNDSSSLMHWEQTYPQFTGATLLELRNDGTDDGTNGPACMLGGPYDGYGGHTSGLGLWNNILPIIDNLTFLLPYNGTYCGVDFYGCGEAAVPTSIAVNTLAVALFGESGPPYPVQNNFGNITNTWVFGVRMPSSNNNEKCEINKITTQGVWIGLMASEHTYVHEFRCQYAAACLLVYSGNGGMPHAVQIEEMIVGESYAAVEAANDGPVHVLIQKCDWESMQYPIADIGNCLYGRILFHDNTPLGYHDGTLTDAVVGNGTNGALDGAQHVTLTQYELVQQVCTSGGGTAPAAPASGSSQQNLFYKDAQLWLSASSGTITAVEVINQDKSTNISLPITTGAAVGPISVPSGMFFKPTYTGTLSVQWIIGSD